MIRIERLTVEAGTFRLRDLSLTVPGGAYGVLMGRTGCGKSTLLEAVCGLRRVTAGRIELWGKDVTRRATALRGIGYVPQDGALFHTLSVRENIAFALDVWRVAPRQAGERVAELAGLLGLAPLLGRPIAGLSGGERQRVALGRALAFKPRTLLLDEPLSAVDEETREDMLALLKSVQRHTGATILHVTHNRSEAERLADTIYRLQDGQIRPWSADPPPVSRT